MERKEHYLKCFLSKTFLKPDFFFLSIKPEAYLKKKFQRLMSVIVSSMQLEIPQKETNLWLHGNLWHVANWRSQVLSEKRRAYAC